MKVKPDLFYVTQYIFTDFKLDIRFKIFFK